MQSQSQINTALLERLYSAQNAAALQQVSQQQTAVINCPKKMVGRVIGKEGSTIKSLQQFTGAQIQIDQRCDPTRVSVAGSGKSLQLAVSMIQDIVAGTFKGFAMLRQMGAAAEKAPAGLEFMNQPQPVYIEGYGFVPPSQFYDPSEVSAPALPSLQGVLDVGLLRSQSPCTTSGTESPVPTPLQQSLDAGSDALVSVGLSAALANPRLYSLRSASPLRPQRSASPSFPSPPYMSQQQPQQPSPLPKAPTSGSSQKEGSAASASRHAQMASVARSLFGGEDGLEEQDKDFSSAQPVGLPPLHRPISNPSSVPQMPTVWSQLERLSPDSKASPSPILERTLTPDVQTLSYGSTPNPSPPPPVDTSKLWAQLQQLTLQAGNQINLGAAQTQAPVYSSGWPVAPLNLPPGWMELTDPDGRRFFHNPLTGQSQFDCPVDPQQHFQAASSLYSGAIMNAGRTQGMF